MAEASRLGSLETVILIKQEFPFLMEHRIAVWRPPRDSNQEQSLPDRPP